LAATVRRDYRPGTECLAQLTQVEVARRLAVGQAAVSRMENRGDMLLSTLYDYLTATGAGADADTRPACLRPRCSETGLRNWPDR
jgi:hypothetical protein